MSEKILRIFYSGDIPDENGLQLEDGMLLIAQAINTVVPQNLFENMKADAGRVIDTMFISTFEDVPIQYSTTRFRYFVDLPFTPIALPYNNGISIGPMGDHTERFTPVALGFTQKSKGTPLANLEGRVGFELQGKKAYLVNFDLEMQENLKNVIVQMVADISDFDQESEVPVPPIYHTAIFDEVLKRLSGRVPDAINDNKIQ